MKKGIFKSLFLLVLVSALSIGATYSSFYNKVTSNGNTISAGVLSFDTLDKNGVNPLSQVFTDSNNEVDGAFDSNMVLKNTGTLPFEYSISVATTSGDLDLCNNLVLKSKKVGDAEFSQNLSSFNQAGLTLSNNTSSLFDFGISTPDGDEYKGKTCNFTFAIKAHQVGLTDSSGFTYVKYLINSVKTEQPAPELTVSLVNGNTTPTLHISVTNISNFAKIKFDYTYKRSDDIVEGGQGEENLTGDNSYTKDILLGSQSGNDFIYYVGAHDIEVTVTLTDSSNNQTILGGHTNP